MVLTTRGSEDITADGKPGTGPVGENGGYGKGPLRNLEAATGQDKDVGRS